MLGNHGRSITKAIFTPVARVLVAAHITPNMVTIAGTVVTIAVAVTTFPLATFGKAPSLSLSSFSATRLMVFSRE